MPSIRNPIRIRTAHRHSGCRIRYAGAGRAGCARRFRFVAWRPHSQWAWQAEPGFQAAIDQVQAVGSKGEINPSDLLKAQFSLLQVSVQQDVTSKAVGKATQTLDTLLKNQ